MAYTTIDDPTLFFRVKAYSGTESAHAETFDITDTSMQPDMVWIKNRDTTGNHGIWDSVRGATYEMYPDVNSAQYGESQGLKSWNTDGYALGNNAGYNASGGTYVGWTWKTGTTSGITTNGSTTITPSGYSFNSTVGVSILTYQGNGTAGAKLAHGLG